MVANMGKGSHGRAHLSPQPPLTVLPLGDVKPHLSSLSVVESDAELARGECVSAEEFAEVMRQRRAQ
jgi:hypothetical protein